MKVPAFLNTRELYNFPITIVIRINKDQSETENLSKKLRRRINCFDAYLKVKFSTASFERATFPILLKKAASHSRVKLFTQLITLFTCYLHKRKNREKYSIRNESKQKFSEFLYFPSTLPFFLRIPFHSSSLFLSHRMPLQLRSLTPLPSTASCPSSLPSSSSVSPPISPTLRDFVPTIVNAILMTDVKAQVKPFLRAAISIRAKNNVCFVSFGN